MTRAQYLKARVERLQSQGLCVTCGFRPTTEGSYRCDFCGERHRAQQRMYRVLEARWTPRPLARRVLRNEIERDKNRRTN